MGNYRGSFAFMNDRLTPGHLVIAENTRHCFLHMYGHISPLVKYNYKQRQQYDGVRKDR